MSTVTATSLYPLGYDMLKQLYQFRQGQGQSSLPLSDGYNVERRVLLALAELIDKTLITGTISCYDLRDIARSQPEPQSDPIDELTPEDRAGYEACNAYNHHLFDYAKKVYVTSRENYATQRMQWNAAAAAVQKAGAK